MSSGQGVQVNLPHLEASTERFNDLLAGLEIVASPPISLLAQQLYDATARCLDVMYQTSEDCLRKFGPRPAQW